MGKITGFIEFERVEEGYKPVPERLKHYKEFVLQQRLPGQQHHSGLQRSGVQQRLAKRIDGFAQHQQLSRVHRPHLPRTLRSRLHLECERRRGRHQID
jgi:hypothetical protein